MQNFIDIAIAHRGFPAESEFRDKMISTRFLQDGSWRRDLCKNLEILEFEYFRTQQTISQDQEVEASVKELIKIQISLSCIDLHRNVNNFSYAFRPAAPKCIPSDCNVATA